ncbi:hypothetical protein B0T16DRAFT_96562 [Cercophora newfieldiana]|uniref:Uncharacterized protein n=1 Tax=Cercophora newfieldiana TaxID=92897 RepID=A0AA40CUP3_9PEZI|nr:hypothetical protein B0T16DRAFT_96562 [Cercophora newfieldiana]
MRKLVVQDGWGQQGIQFTTGEAKKTLFWCPVQAARDLFHEGWGKFSGMIREAEAFCTTLLNYPCIFSCFMSPAFLLFLMHVIFFFLSFGCRVVAAACFGCFCFAYTAGLFFPPSWETGTPYDVMTWRDCKAGGEMDRWMDGCILWRRSRAKEVDDGETRSGGEDKGKETKQTERTAVRRSCCRLLLLQKVRLTLGLKEGKKKRMETSKQRELTMSLTAYCAESGR